MVKLADVARRAGVSPATVSRALNGIATVDTALAERVRAAATELGYRPNRVARSLRRQRSDVWALLVSDITNPFFTALARGAEDVASAHGYSLLLCNTDEDPAKEERYLSVVELEQVSGVVLVPATGTDDRVARLVRSGVPVVTVDRPLPAGDGATGVDGVDDVPDVADCTSSGSAFDAVLTDSRDAAATATEHLLAQGWQRPACVTGPATAATAVERREGYLAAMAAADLGAEARVRHAPYGVAGGRAAAETLLAEPVRPDAFVVANALMALGVLGALRDAGLRTGDDVGLVCFDDAPWAEVVDPPVSVLVQPAYAMGARAAELLLARVEGGDQQARAPQTVVLDTELVVRGSSLRPPVPRVR